MRLKETLLGVPETKSITEVLREKGLLITIIGMLAVSLAIFHLYTSYAGALEALRHRSVHLLVVLIIIFLISITKRKHKWYRALDITLVLLTTISLVYTFSYSESIAFRAGNPNPMDYAIGTIVLLLAIEGARRAVGLAIAALTGLFLIYTYFGPLFPGFLKHAPYSFGEIINIQYLELEGVWGIPTGAMSTYIIIFLLFAGILVQTGMLNVFMDLSMKLFGRTTGGPAKVAVAASTLVGSVSGSAAANALLTGQISIPLMKKMGYKPTFAGAVEASVSSGGQFMPPIMGAAAFIIAMFLGISYLEVCIAAAIPALLWFFSFFVIVHLTAKRLQLKTLSKEEVSALPWSSILTRLYLFVPMIVLICVLVMGYTAILAGFYGVVSLFALSFVRKETRFNLSSLAAALRNGIKMTLPITTACGCASIIVGCIMQSGLGYTLSASLIEISRGQLFLLLPMVLLASLILGVGMTTVGAYVVVAVLVAPAMVELGMNPLSAHLFAFYFAIISAVTPPVATAAYAAAGIAGTSPWSTGLMAFRLCIPALCIPFVFATQPALLLIGDPLSILITVATTAMGIICLDGVVAGYLLRNCKIHERLILVLAGIAFLFPTGVINLIGLGLLAFVILLQKWTR